MIIPIIDIVLLPGMTYALRLNHFSEEESAYVKRDEQQVIALPMKHYQKKKALTPEDFHKIGVALDILEVEEADKGTHIQVKVKNRVTVSGLEVSPGLITGTVDDLPEDVDLTEKSQDEMVGYIKKISKEVAAKFRDTDSIMQVIEEMTDLNVLIGHISQFLPLSNEERVSLMETSSLKERSLMFIDYFLRQKESLQLQMEMAERFSEKANKNYREAALREQLRVIQEELGEGKGDGKRKDKDYRNRIDAAGMPEEIKEAALEELDKLESQQPSSPDYNVIRNYLDLIVGLPWKLDEDLPINLAQARRILNEQHFGLDKVKDRIIQHLAVMHLKKDKKGSILLLVGPPGTGKTSLGKSIAEALDRKYVRISLGGVRDEAEIRGHRRTYIGAMAGRIIQSIKKAGSMNPVMVLDEVDKLMVGYNGDPASALLEVLDPEQNNTFTDHYLDLPYDLSNVFFIATANSLESIPRPLLDRMEVIQISSYTSSEKFHIGKDHLIEEVLQEHGLTEEELVIEDDTLHRVISDFTMEAGVRGLKKQLATLARVTTEKVVLGEAPKPLIIHPDDLDEMLGRQVSRHDLAGENNPPGVVTGMAWTSVGGEILFIEASGMPGSGQVQLTGKLGDVMKESAKISLSLLKSRLSVSTNAFKERDIHIHVPSGAVPKDGPSAGIALFSALASLVTGIPVDGRLAMTGEITLRGVVLPIGGLKEKLIAAQRAGIVKALIPADNVIDLKDVPDEVKNAMTIIPVETVEDVLRETLNISLPRVILPMIEGNIVAYE